jgi:hypothetical protein
MRLLLVRRIKKLNNLTRRLNNLRGNCRIQLEVLSNELLNRVFILIVLIIYQVMAIQAQ